MVETERDAWHQTYEKTVIRVRKKQYNVHNHMIICKLLLKAQNMLEIYMFSKIIKNLSGCFSNTEYL